jgi:hypothetical protein
MKEGGHRGVHPVVAKQAGSRLRAGLVLLLCVPWLVPLLRAGMIQSHEGLSYPIRLVELLRCWQDGFISAHWFPDLFFGQGYPFLCFYAPAVFYLGGLFHSAGASIALSLKLTAVLAILAGAAGAYRLAREIGPPPAALVGAALYTYAPYHVRDLFIRGDFAEFLALGFLPWAVWAVLRLRRRQGARDVALAAFCGALPILSHNITGLFTGGGMVLAGAAAVAYARERGRAAVAALVAGIGTLLTTVFFWLPALHERQWVQIGVLTRGDFAVERHFVRPLELLLPGRTPGIGQELPMSFEIGYAALVLSLLGLLSWRRRSEGAQAALLLGACLAGLGLALTTSLGAPVYRLLPMLRFVQFPWRFLGITSLGLALLGAAGTSAILQRARERWRWAAAIALVAAAVLPVSPLLGPKGNFPPPAWALDPATYEQQRETTTKGEYLPRWVAESERPRRFENGVRIDGEGRIEAPERRAGRWTFRVVAEEEVTVVLRELYYPRWRGWLGEHEVRLEPSEGTGRIEFVAPAGRHEFRARFTRTPLRETTGWISGGAALLLGIALLRARRRNPPIPREGVPSAG